jgi:hypothetical protein
MADFATLADLAVRLGRASSSELTAAQQAQGTLLLTLATGLITQAVDRDSTWADALSPVPTLLRAITLEVAARVMQNPVGARSESETLGQYQHSTSFTDRSHGLMLTDAEVVLCRRVIVGVSSGSAALDSMVTVLANNETLFDGWSGEEVELYDWTA